MTRQANVNFDLGVFLKSAGQGRSILRLERGDCLFTQGEPANFVFYIQQGGARLTVLSDHGRQATITVLSEGDFLGEESMTDLPGRHVTTATATAPSAVLKIQRDVMSRLLREEASFSAAFVSFLLGRSLRTQAVLVDHFFSTSEQRLAKVLLEMASGAPEEHGRLIPQVTQEALADLVGTTRSRVSFFMNRFRQLGLITYDSRIHVHESLLSVLLPNSVPSSYECSRK